MSVVIETTIGDLTVDLFTKERPQASLNFLKLCKLKYYNYNLFHNIERNFIAQTGDPSGAGDGGESVWGVIEGSHKRFFTAENLPKIKHEIPGLISLVSIGKNMVSSQFFFTLGQDLLSLDNIHCVIGEVVEGHDVLRKLNEAIVDEHFRPYQDIRITHTVILEDPFDDPRGFRTPSRSPSPSAERLKNGKIAADENIDDTEGKTTEEIQEMLAVREAKARATILEIVGDLPDAEIAPPDNVLFVCKLNPVTAEDDLEILFSRFGRVVGCEVIKDKISGDSLQYAFVEFEDKKACEAAYFKMDNVLIDDRRIHVDFSQSVAKVQWRGKGRGLIHKDGKEDRKIDFNNYRNRNSKQENRSHLEKKKKSPPSKRDREKMRRSNSRSFRQNSPKRREYFSERDKDRRVRDESRSKSSNRKRFQSRYDGQRGRYESQDNLKRRYDATTHFESSSHNLNKSFLSSTHDDRQHFFSQTKRQGSPKNYERLRNTIPVRVKEITHRTIANNNIEISYKVYGKSKKSKKSKVLKLKKNKKEKKTSKKKRRHYESSETSSTSSFTESSDSSTKKKKMRREKKRKCSNSSDN